MAVLDPGHIGWDDTLVVLSLKWVIKMVTALRIVAKNPPLFIIRTQGTRIARGASFRAFCMTNPRFSCPRGVGSIGKLCATTGAIN